MKRLLTGDRPTGKLHLGHYIGSIRNRVRFQNEYESFIFVADLHMLTTRPSRDSIMEIGEHSRDIVLDYLACGINPEKVCIYLQSAIHEVYELNLLLGMLVTVPRLERLPSLKDMLRDAHMEEMSFGLLGYPVLQSADILLPRAHVVPVGKDNEAHVEIAREIARRFNYHYGEVFPEPEPIIQGGTLIGTDGKAKMSKSLGNAILLSDDAKTTAKKVHGMYTDPQRTRADIPGKVEGNPVFIYHETFNENADEVEDLKSRYREGKVGDVEVKQKLARAINCFMEPIRERRECFASKNGFVDELMYSGSIKMREVAQSTIIEVKKAMGLTGVWNRISRKAEKYRNKVSH